ncbi:MAG: hypothetical protein Homavirus40_4, partial [Homavirus sp.]
VGEPDDYFNYLYTCGGYEHNVSNLENLQDYIYSNEDVSVEYKKVSTWDWGTTIKNPGFIVVLSGLVVTRPNNVLLIPIKEITSYDVCALNDVELIIIHYVNNKHHKQIWNISEFIRGWFIGNFIPSIIRTTKFEIAVINHKQY